VANIFWLWPEKNTKGQFHQHFKSIFCQYLFSKKSQSRSLIREKLQNLLSYEKCVRKMLVKLTPKGLSRRLSKAMLVYCETIKRTCSWIKMSKVRNIWQNFRLFFSLFSDLWNRDIWNFSQLVFYFVLHWKM